MTKRIAIIGCGEIAKTHGLCIQDLNFQLVVVTSRTRRSAETFADSYPELRADFLGAEEWVRRPQRDKLRKMFPTPVVYADVDDMRNAGPLNAVIISTHPDSHCNLTCRVAERLDTKTILCEKPMALSFDEGQRTIAACKEKGIRLAVYNDSHLTRHHFQYARKMLLQGQIGKVEFVRASSTSTLMNWSEPISLDREVRIT